MSETPLYSVGTWDTCEQAYTPQAGLSVPWMNVPIVVLRKALKELRTMGYGAWRVRVRLGATDYSHDSDYSVLVERTDGMIKADILERWKR